MDPVPSDVSLQIDQNLAQQEKKIRGNIADDTQLFISRKPNETFKSSKLTECVKNVKYWMTNNFLLLNSYTTKILLIEPKVEKIIWLESLPGQENMIILLQFYSLCTGYLLGFVSVTKYDYLPIRP